MLITLYLDTNICYSDSVKIQLRASRDQALALLYKEKQQQQQQQCAVCSSSLLEAPESVRPIVIQRASHAQAHQDSARPKILNIQWGLPGDSNGGKTGKGRSRRQGPHSGTESQGLKFRVPLRVLWANPQSSLAVLSLSLSLLCPATLTLSTVWH